MEKYIQRFWDRVEKTEDCWNWTRGTNDRGYGIFYAGKMRRSHVFAYEITVGPVPINLELDHLCRNRLCVNPGHLEPVTHQENCRRGIGSKTHCVKGHEFTPENTKVNRNRRICRTCLNSSRRKRYEAHPRAPKTHCPLGHPLSGDNLYVNRLGYKECRTCRQVARLRYQNK